MQVSCRRVRSTTHSGVAGQTGSAQTWSTIHQQLRVPDLPPDVSLTDWASCPQQVTLVMMRSVVSTAQSINNQLAGLQVSMICATLGQYLFNVCPLCIRDMDAAGCRYRNLAALHVLSVTTPEHHLVGSLRQ